MITKFASKMFKSVRCFHVDPKAPHQHHHFTLSEDNRGFNDFVNQTASENRI